ncbi:MAG: GNAT family N-acetyltransferase [Candidatus Eisenbacteria bacterium]|nr:GNAT family N-acetyltransferase [Candidatus Eisenbacteria bacterium]
MTIQRLTPAHASAYRSLMLEAYDTRPVAFGTTSHEAAGFPMSWWETRTHDAPDSTCLVMGVLDGDALMGAAGLLFEARERACHRATLFGMYLRPVLRGAGLGRMLVTATLDAARSRPGVRVVQLSAIEGNEGALRLYEKCGFVRYGLEPMCFSSDGGWLSRVHMWRELEAR